MVFIVAEESPGPMEIRSLSPIRTAENVTLQVELAGLGNRILAYCIDFLAMGSLITAVALLFGMALSWESEWTKTALPLALFVVFFGFQFFQEWLWNGKTLGKHVLGLRVVRNNGQPLGFWEAFGRNLLRVVDIYLMGAGLVCMMISPREKRFGDFLSGTLVIREPALHKPFTPTPDGLECLLFEEQELLRAFAERKARLLPTERQALTQALRDHFSPRLQAAGRSPDSLDFLLD